MEELSNSKKKKSHRIYKAWFLLYKVKKYGKFNIIFFREINIPS